MPDQNIEFTPSILERVSKAIRTKVNGKGYPGWFVRLNKLSLCPTFLWPIVLFGSIFLFDNPSNLVYTFLIFLLIISYPIILLRMVILSYKLYRAARIVAIVIPVINLTFWAAILFDFFL